MPLSSPIPVGMLNRKYAIKLILPFLLSIFIFLWLKFYSFQYHSLAFDLDHDSMSLHPQSPLSRPIPPQKITPGPDASIWAHRQKQVREAFEHALAGYKNHSFPNDELLPISGGSSNKFNGWSVTLLDSMDTMWIMGLHDEFENALSVVASVNFTYSYDMVAFFETTIRYLGGLLSAYSLSNEPILITRAEDLARALLPVFDGTPSGLPTFSVNVQTGHTGFGWLGNNVLFSEATSCQLEFKYLAKLTGRKEYYQKVEHIMDLMYNASNSDGLFPILWSPEGGPRSDHYSVGASGDSGYEYLLKQYLLTGDRKALSQYLKSITGILNNLFYLTPNRKLLYVTDIYTLSTPSPSHKLEHLSCFLPGVLALGAHLLPESINGTTILSAQERQRHMWAARGLGYTCWTSYADSVSGLGPDGLVMESTGAEKWVDVLESWEEGGRRGVVPGLGEDTGDDGERMKRPAGERDYTGSGGYYLRPETIESLYILWKTTGEPKWRERGWKIFESIENYTKTEYGYASVDKVDMVPPRLNDDMPSYFLAETLKYLYLLFEDNTDSFPLERWVFNTEAHPLPVFNWTKWESKWYGIETL